MLAESYVVTARAKGLREMAVVGRHVMKNALIPVITVIGLQTGWLLNGAVLVEVVFGWPGLGRYTVDSIASVDFPAVMGVTLLIAVAFTLINLLVDIAYGLVDPRIRMQ